METTPLKILIASCNRKVMRQIGDALSQLNNTGYSSEISYAQDCAEAKKLISDTNNPTLIFIDFDSLSEDKGWELVDFIRTSQNNDASRIYIYSETDQNTEAMVKYNISDLVNENAISKNESIAAVSASIKSFERATTIAASAKQLSKQQDPIEEETIVEGIQELQKNEQRLQTILDSLLSPVFIARLSDGEILFMNNNAREKFAIRNKNMRKINKAHLHANPEEHEKSSALLQKKGKLEGYEVKMQALSGLVFYALKSSAIIKYDGDSCVLSSFNDISAHKEMTDDLEQLATVDHLTGMNNRRQLLKLSTVEIQRAKRYNYKMSVIMLDIDHFKIINDRYGHHAGDLALIALADKFEHVMREIDIYGRMGGEEFAIILPQTDYEAANKMAARLQDEIEKILISIEDISFGFTVSIGITQYHQDETIEEALDRADRALFMAKEGGRNLVVTAP
ncbi:MAG: GGDEF domain-containing protein [Alphaproteobacteria bacterium]|nr:GGDEF domain-containing protein [Alphaproteobacteria bacterium]